MLMHRPGTGTPDVTYQNSTKLKKLICNNS